MAEPREVNMKVITFSGKKDDWLIWEERMMSKSKKKGYRDLLLGREDVICMTSQEIDVDNEEEMRLRRINDEAYLDLINSMDCDTEAGKIDFSVVKGSKNEEYEDGNALVAYTNLKSKYLPSTTIDLMKLENEYQGSKMKKNEDNLIVNWKG